MKEVESLGGIAKCVEDRIIQKKLAEQAYEVHKKIESGEMIRVGVNKFKLDEKERDVEVFQVDPRTLPNQIKRLKDVKASGYKRHVAGFSEEA